MNSSKQWYNIQGCYRQHAYNIQNNAVCWEKKCSCCMCVAYLISKSYDDILTSWEGIKRKESLHHRHIWRYAARRPGSDACDGQHCDYNE